jgi:hypothetical protein
MEGTNVAWFKVLTQGFTGETEEKREKVTLSAAIWTRHSHSTNQKLHIFTQDVR